MTDGKLESAKCLKKQKVAKKNDRRRFKSGKKSVNYARTAAISCQPTFVYFVFISCMLDAAAHHFSPNPLMPLSPFRLPFQFLSVSFIYLFMFSFRFFFYLLMSFAFTGLNCSRKRIYLLGRAKHRLRTQMPVSFWTFKKEWCSVKCYEADEY